MRRSVGGRRGGARARVGLSGLPERLVRGGMGYVVVDVNFQGQHDATFPREQLTRFPTSRSAPLES
jgi:hypothetical protein